MKRRSISGFILGLLGAISTAIVSFALFLVLTLVFGLSDSLGGDVSGGLGITLFTAAYFISSILAIIASCFYFKKARVGGIIMIFAFLLNVSLVGYSLYLNAKSAIEIVDLLIIIPTLFIFLSMILGLTSKARPIIVDNKNTNQTPPPVNQIKYCPKCGSSMKINDDFCPFCGTKQ